ncbi:MAG: sugar phosphate isomerase/epimerase family protein [Clostridia bacterium]
MEDLEIGGDSSRLLLNRVAISTGTLPYALGRPYHDIGALRSATAALGNRSFELVLHPDWRTHPKPRTRQPSPWEESPGFDFEDMSTWLTGELRGIHFLSLHGNRDLGSFLASWNPVDRVLGREILKNNIEVAHRLGAGVVVVHAWDPRHVRPQLAEVGQTLAEESSRHPGVNLSVENIPTNGAASSQPRSLESILGAGENLGVTLDLSWVSHHGNLEDFHFALEKINNVHVQGRMSRRPSGEILLLTRGRGIPLEGMMYRLLEWGYDGQWTLELNRARSLRQFIVVRSHIESIISGGERCS